MKSTTESHPSAFHPACRSSIPYTADVPPTRALEDGSSTDVEEDKRREKEHKKRSKNWTRLETLDLIKLRSQLAPRFARGGRKSELWDEIAEALQSRDAHQCRDKWEKLMAAYKDVRDGLKEREHNPYYDELHPLLCGDNVPRGEKERDGGGRLLPNENLLDVLAQHTNSDTGEDCNYHNVVRNKGDHGGEALELNMEEDGVASDGIIISGQKANAGKRKRNAKFCTDRDLDAVRSLLETFVSKQQRFFEGLLDAMEEKQQERERIRQEREDKWRTEERAQCRIFNNAMLVLTQKLVGERVRASAQGITESLDGNHIESQVLKKRSKNWKQTEVLQLIRLRREMEIRFAKSTRRAALWDELADVLATEGIQRDGKQCREKWDKLMSEHKEVVDGKRDGSDSLYFSELTSVVGTRPVESGVD